ncbi:MAG: patatin-like phospholipase family protein [Bacteroidetes bacterium]|jgi:NTE family protein|nr:patatin-like phospholipase family protein [Bacteroidota bacterium]
MATKKIDLALQGGGAHGAFTWGVIDRLLEEERIEIEGVCGTSAGAMNGVCTIYGLNKGGRAGAKKLLETFWKKISDAGKQTGMLPSWYDKIVSKGNMDFSPTYRMFSMMSENMSPYKFNPTNINPLEKIVLELIDFKELQQMNPPKLFVCATNVKTCQPRVFGPSEITAKAILASACLPYMYQAVEIDGESYWDGGYMGNPPIQPLIDEPGTDDVLIIQINPIFIKETPTTIEDIRDRVNELSFNSSLVAELKHILFQQELIDKGITLDGKLRRTYLHSISSDDALGNLNLSSKLNTDWDFLSYLKETGRQHAESWIKINYDKLGKESTCKLH